VSIGGRFPALGHLAETATIQIVPFIGTSVIAGYGTAATNLLSTALHDGPNADLGAAARTGFLEGALGGALGTAGALAFGARAVTKSPLPGWLVNGLKRTDLPQWRMDVLHGHEFNYDNYGRYAQREVRLVNRKIVDSYTPGKWIVSRKYSQLASIRESTARSYLRELKVKYEPGTGIRGSEAKLKGVMILEIPVQTGPIPPSVLQYASTLKITIRDVAGKIYNPGE
jgi:hypothetical protein